MIKATHLLPTVLLAFLLLAPSSWGADSAAAETAFAEGNTAFESADYPAAIAAYERAAEALGSPTDLLAFQLGNAHLRSDAPGKAALWYSRALAANPRFAEARQNLDVVVARTGALEFEPGWAAPVNRYLPPLATALLASLLLWLAPLLLVVGIRRSHRSERPLRAGLLGLPLFLLLCGLALWFGLYKPQLAAQNGGLGNAVVIAVGASALSQPNPASAAIIELPAGSQVSIESERSAWTYVGLPDGLHGWVKSEQLAPIQPTSD